MEGPSIEAHGVELLLIPGGTFWMGTAEDDEQAFSDEHPRHEVTLAPFYLAKTPVTNAQYARYLQANPNAPKPEYWGDRQYNQPQQPVAGVSWDQAEAYCAWAGLILPTEAQWEYASRAGTQTRYWSGDEEADLARVGWYRKNSDKRLHAVAELPANPWGLHDMHGNVWEWCLEGALGRGESEPYETPVRRQLGDGYRVIRGGSWLSVARYVRAACRSADPVDGRDPDLGFRPVRGIGT